MKPSIGRIVHHRESAKAPCQAAIVVAVDGDTISEVLFRDGTNDTQQPWALLEVAQWRTGVPAEGDADGPTWHWPEREDEDDEKPAKDEK